MLDGLDRTDIGCAARQYGHWLVVGSGVGVRLRALVGKKPVVRALSLVPAAYAIGAVFYLVAGGPTGWQFGVVHGSVMIAAIVLIVRSIVHIRRNGALSSEAKMTWVFLTVFVGFIALPAYWHVVIRRPPRSGRTAGRADAA